MSLFLFILFLCWACAWMFLLGLGALALMGVIALYDWIRARFIAWRDQRELDAATDYLMQIGFLEAARRNYLQDDTQ